MRVALGRGLRAEGFDVVSAADGPSGLSLALTNSFDVIVLEIMLPGLSGSRLLQRLRAQRFDTPVLLISAKAGEVDQADGLDLGADGFLVKPCSLLVLLAHIRALLRRREQSGENNRDDSDRVGRQARVGGLIVDPVSRQARYGEGSVDLSPREFAVLYALAWRAETTVTKYELLKSVWGREHAATAHAVEIYIRYLRRELHTIGASQLLRTVGCGYQLSAIEPATTKDLPDNAGQAR